MLNGFWLLSAALLTVACVPDARGVADSSKIGPAQAQVPASVPAAVSDVIEEPPPTKTVGEILEHGVLI
ncbi:MAG TPA: hypothetical protein VK913_08820, partial [Erythrobacter sp.]|nr:hypothetical protein [Erythrobacter sp.]